MKHLLILALAILSITASCRNEKAYVEPQLTGLEKYTDSLFTASIDSSMVAGGAVLIHQNGETLLKQAYGQASLELDVPMPENASFEIGSVTKQFTAVAILKLVEEGKLSLEDDFTKYLDYDTKGRKVTINHLLNHTSGIASYTEIEEFGSLVPQDLPRDSLTRIIETKDFLFEPGEALIYNNSAYFFLGLIIEKVTEKAYEQYLDEVIFEPLGMKNTYYCSTSKAVKNKAYGYDFSPEGLQQKQYLNHKWPYAAGSLCSTTEDLLIWMNALHNQKIVSNEQYQELITPKTLNDGIQVRYAMGLTNFTNYGHQEIGHGGGIPGFLSDTRYYPEEDLYIICLVNTAGPHGGNFFANKITWNILEKKEYEGIELDFDPNEITGTYSGQTRGRKQSVNVQALTDAITIEFNGNGKIDTLRTYIGDYTWMDGNTKIRIKDDLSKVDQVSGFYIMKKK
ncbi:serine hydrolase domain-containing protein [Croceitalea vernalis]|uniref:Serine hydrolase domain-containing protein n=1 Tax=Croceitalea vernalis TaxID=3075599 RepID=A0ABU3BIJ6_9FLAO|nr:serine hydrolase domain-containing protein [Croceitalea sp. P007]MDT0621979.1 serine hydrolase domain-containing protein [Croceitalea sp. P007]